MDNKNQTTDKEITLRDFLLREHELISSLGVFIALTIFSHSFLEGVFATILSLLFLLLTLLIFFELWEQFPKENGSRKLSLFESYLSIGSVLIFIFWLAQLKDFDEGWPIFVITLLLYGPIMTLLSTRVIKKLNVFNKIFNTKDNERKTLRHIFGYAMMVLVFFIIYIILYNFKDYINRFLDMV